jgi:uncharacterized protein (TIGR03118 family)
VTKQLFLLKFLLKNFITMKKNIYDNAFLASLLVLICFYSCKKNNQNVNVYNIVQTNLVADTAGFGAAIIDTNLLNAWGIAVNPMGIVWISSNHKAVSTVYNKSGQTLMPAVTIPSVASNQPGAPSGIVFNGSTNFGGNKFIFAGEDGVITAWASGAAAAVEVADMSSSNAVYKGLTIATDGAANFLYVANFKGGKIDVFDNTFTYITSKPFLDNTIPAGFGPFNIQNIGGMLYVTYAKLKAPDDMDDQAGSGNGYVDIFRPDGTLVKRFASQGALNSPWGITHAPAGFTDSTATILVGNFGDGRINIFDSLGNYKGQLQHSGQVIRIDGLWAIDFLKTTPSSTDSLYFTAGPGGESHGLFGYLQKFTKTIGGY